MAIGDLLIPTELPTENLINWDAARQRCNCIFPAGHLFAGQRVCKRRDNLGLAIISSVGGIKYYLEELRSYWSSIFQICFGYFPVEWFPNYWTHVIYPDPPAIPYDAYSIPIHGFSSYEPNFINLEDVIYVTSGEINILEIEKQDEGDILTTNVDLRNLKFGKSYYSIEYPDAQPRCIYNIDWVDTDENEVPVYPLECGKNNGHIYTEHWTGCGNFKRKKISPWAEYYGLRSQEHTDATKGIPCANTQCPDYQNLQVTTIGGENPGPQSYRISVDISCSIQEGDVIVFTQGYLSNPVYANNVGKSLMYHGGRQFLVDKILPDDGVYTKIKLKNVCQNDLINAPFGSYGGDSFVVVRLKDSPVWSWVTDNQRRMVYGNYLETDVISIPNRGTIEIWEFNGEGNLREGDIARVGKEYIQIMSVDSEGDIMSCHVRRGYFDENLLMYNQNDNEGGDENIHPIPCVEPITEDNSIMHRHPKGSGVVVDMRKCWFDYTDHCNGIICIRRRPSIADKYQGGSTDVCTNTTCHTYWSRPAIYRSTIFHELVHRVTTREGHQQTAIIYNDKGNSTATILDYFLTEVTGPSAMACLGKWGLIETMGSSQYLPYYFNTGILNCRNYGWRRTYGADIVEGELEVEFDESGDPIDYGHPHNGAICQFREDALMYIDNTWQLINGGDWVVGGDIAVFAGMDGNVKPGIIYQALGAMSYRNRHFYDENDKPTGSGMIVGMRRLSLLSWCIKPLNGFSGNSLWNGVERWV